MLETLDDIPALPEQPSLDRGILERAPKSQKKKVIAAAKPILATATAATSRRVGPVLPPVPPATREIFKDLVVKQKLKGRALYRKASDVVDDRGRLSKALASWITETDDDGAYLIPESFWGGISHVKNPAAANTTLLNAGGKVRRRRQKVRVQGHDSTTGRFTAADSQAQLTKLGNELVYRSRVLGEGYGDLGSLQRKNDKQKYLEWVEETIWTMKNNQVIFEEGVRDVAATVARKVQRQLKEVTLENRSLIKHVELQAKLITEFIGRIPEIETATGGLDSSAPPKLNSVSPWRSIFIPLESRCPMVRAP